MNVEEAGNLIEAALWVAVSAIWIAKSTRSSGPVRSVFVLLALMFFAFGVTDLIEAQTGAWWRPWWLLLFKASCVAGIAFGFGRLYIISRRRRDAPNVTEPPDSPLR